MILDFVIAILIVRYLRRTLETAKSLPAWDKIFNIIFFASIACLAVSILSNPFEPVMIWVAHAFLLFILYILYTQKEFRAARSYMIAIFPYILVSLAVEILKQFFKKFYNMIKWIRVKFAYEACYSYTFINTFLYPNRTSKMALLVKAILLFINSYLIVFYE